MIRDRKLAKRITKYGYFRNWPTRNNYYPEHLKLWRSVLDMALADLLCGAEYYAESQDNNVEDEELTWESLLEWFDMEDEDFQFVCTMAELPHHLV